MGHLHSRNKKKVVTRFLSQPFPTISQVKGARKIARKRKRQNQGTPNKAPFVKIFDLGKEVVYCKWFS